MTVADFAAGVALGVAIYEAAAVWTHKVPTITDLLNGRPKLFRLALLVAANLWALDHFKVVDI